MDLSWIWGHHFFLMCWKVKIRSNMKIYEDRHEAYKSTWLFLTCCSLIPWLMFFFSTKKLYWVIHRCFFFVPSMNVTILFGNICRLSPSVFREDCGSGWGRSWTTTPFQKGESDRARGRIFFRIQVAKKKIQIKQISLNTTHAKYDVQITTYKV